MNEVKAAFAIDWKTVLLGVLILFEIFKYLHDRFEWLDNIFRFETKKKREKREATERLAKVEKDIEEIKKNSDRNCKMFLEHEEAVVGKFSGIRDEIVEELRTLHTKLDEQKVESDETDCAMLRDRIASGMRYFSQFKDADGNVHISFSDYENMSELFDKYFAKNGNGAFRHMYENEFKHFIIDR